MVLGASSNEYTNVETVKPGFYEFRPFNGSKPLNANVYNLPRRRWRVDFFDPDTGAKIRTRKGRKANLPWVTVNGARWHGKFIRLVPERSEHEPRLEPQQRSDELSDLRIGRNSTVLVNIATIRDNGVRSSGHQRANEVLCHGDEHGRRIRSV